MSLETGKKIVDYLISEWELDNPTHYINKNVRCVIFSFIGGEPFLEVELIDNILEYFLMAAKLHTFCLGCLISTHYLTY